VDQFPFEPGERYGNSVQDRARLYDFSTGLIRYLVGSLRLNPSGSLSIVAVNAEAKREVDVLKQFIWEYVIENQDLAVVQNGQRGAVRAVFTRLLHAARDKKYYLFPSGYQGIAAKARDKGERVRVVADCLAGMTEKELMHFHRCLQGLAT
jgi:dGTP triphosphohydrolase